MKKLCAAVIVFVVAIVFVAVWFSPLAGIGEAYVYNNNTPVREIGVCYAADDVVRCDVSGGEQELAEIFCVMCATAVKTEHAGGRTIVYAVSPRVAADMQVTCDGIAYNVMAAYGDGHVTVGTPVLQGSF